MDNFDYKRYLKSRRLFEQEYTEESWYDLTKRIFRNDDIGGYRQFYAKYLADYLANIEAKYLEFDDSMDVDVYDIGEEDSEDWHGVDVKEYGPYLDDLTDSFVNKNSKKDSLSFTLFDPINSNFSERYPHVKDSYTDKEKVFIFSNGRRIYVKDKEDIQMIIGAGKL